MITGSVGYTQDGWRDLIATMVQLPAAQAGPMTQYLAAHFPPKPGRAPVLVPGDVSVTFKEWTVPTLGQRSRDPLQTKDGTIWWNGQFISLVGRLNPNTGEMREYELPRASRPHSIVDDAAGNIWYMGNGNGTIGKLVPATGQITEIKMPDPEARDPHTGIFDKNGTLFFTLQQSNMLGRLVPSTGEIKLITLTTPRSLPYGLKQDSKGTVWVSYNGTNKIGSMDPVTMEVREFTLPEGSRVQTARRHQRRHGLVRELRARPPGPVESEDGRHQGVAIAERTAVASLCDRGHRRHHLVQRVEPAAGRAGAVRSQDREVPELGDSVRRRHHPAHAEDARRQSHDPSDQHQPDRPGDHRQARRRRDALRKFGR